MKKEEITRFIKEYNQDKGCRRKYLPFFPAYSIEMIALMNFMHSLYDHVHITESESRRLEEVLMLKRVSPTRNRFKHTPTIPADKVVFDDTLTGKIFQKIYNAMQADPMLKQFKRKKESERAPLVRFTSR